MQKQQKIFAFIDAQNVQMGVKELGWKLDWKRFRIYLKEKFSVQTAYIFLGYIKEFQPLYDSLRRAGYILIFKEVLERRGSQKVKGNIDVELALQVMIDFQKYDQAIIVSSDGDFTCLVKYLIDNKKFGHLLSTHIGRCSILLKRASQGKIRYLSEIQNKIEYI